MTAAPTAVGGSERPVDLVPDAADGLERPARVGAARDVHAVEASVLVEHALDRAREPVNVSRRRKHPVVTDGLGYASDVSRGDRYPATEGLQHG